MKIRKRHIILLVALLVLVGGIASGIGVWVHYNSGDKLLSRVRVAVRAQKLDKALGLAQRYIGQRPTDWRGHFWLGEIYLGRAQYEQARHAYEKAESLNPGDIRPAQGVANSFSHPAAQTLTKLTLTTPIETFAEAVQQLRLANRHLRSIDAADPKQAAEIDQSVGENLERIGYAQAMLGRHLDNDAKLAEAGRAQGVKEEKLRASQAAFASAEAAYQEATEVLLGAVRKDPTRDEAAKMLAEICIRQGYRETLAKARDVIMAAGTRMPEAQTMILMQDLGEQVPELSGAERTKRLAAAGKYLDGLLLEKPNSLPIKVARAQVAMMQGELDLSIRLCDEVLTRDPRQRRARLFKAYSLLEKGRAKDAEGILFQLRTEFPWWPEAHYVFGLAADAIGNTELATEAMRKVTELKPDHAGARRYLASALVRGGYHQRAYAEAMAYYESHPNDPAAVHIFVEAAVRNKRTDDAKKALAKAETEAENRPRMLLAICEGYLLLREPTRAADLARRAAAITPANFDDKLVVAWAKLLAQQPAEAEALLNEAIKEQPDSAAAHYQMARLYDRTQRSMQALEAYRTAVRLRPQATAYHLALAEALFRHGLLDEALQVCQDILETDPANPRAAVLAEQARIILGKPAGDSQVQIPSEGTAGLRLALTYLRSGEAKKCIEVCEDELQRDPESPNARLLLSRAYMATGQDARAADQLAQAIKAAPDNLAVYLGAGAVLSPKIGAAGLVRYFRGIPEAKPDRVNLTLGWVYTQAQDWASADAAYAEVIEAPYVDDTTRNRARMLRAGTLAALHRYDEALAELGKLEAIELWHKRAMFVRARLLGGMGRTDDMDALLVELSKTAGREKDTSLLPQIATLYVQAGRRRDGTVNPDMARRALEVADQLIGISPNDAAPCVLKAQLLTVVNRSNEAIEWYRKAIDRQPNNLRSYVALAALLDGLQKHPEALAELDKLAEIGDTGLTLSLFTQAKLLSSWGLQREAVKRLERLRTQGQQRDPRLRFELASGFVALGETERARLLLQEIPSYSGQYVAAQETLAQLADGADAKLAVLNRLQQTSPGVADVVFLKMGVLAEAERYDEAVEAYQDFRRLHLKDNPVPEALADRALQVLLAAGNPQAAADIAEMMARQVSGMAGGASVWPYRAVLLNLDTKTYAAAAMLPEVEKANGLAASMGVLVAAQQNDAAAARRWAGRLLSLQGEAKAPDDLRLLAAVVAGMLDVAKAELKSYTGAGSVARSAAEELVALADGDPTAAAAEAAQLLRATMGVQVRTTRLARELAWAVLKKRPTSQWAAALIIRVGPDAETLRKVLAELQPPHCFLAQLIQARLFTYEGKHLQAATIYGEAAKAESTNIGLILDRAMALERAQNHEEALDLYKLIWQATRNPVAANNAAFLVARLYPKDKTQLEEVGQWMSVAIDRAPQVAAFWDTKGWLFYLEGKKWQASGYVRRAIKGMPRSPEVHYHLGVIEESLGNNALARWHLEEAVLIGKVADKTGKSLDPSDARAVGEAQKALAQLATPQT